MLKVKLFILFFISLYTFSAFAQSNHIKGKVYDASDFSPLPGAIITLSKLSKSYVSDSNGNFSIENIPSGQYNLEIKYVGFETVVKEISLKNNQLLNLNIALKQSSQQLQAVNVFGTLDKESKSAARTREKNADNMVNVVGAETISKSPDINSANVLKRISGVTIQKNAGGDESYAVIRGIEPRYNNTLINGIKIASPDDKSRYISLDVIPSDLLQKIEVSKSLTPEMEGDAIGGTVNLVFKDAPDNLLINANASLGYNSIFFDRKYIDYSKKDIQQQSVYDRIGPNYVAKSSDFSRSNLDFKQRQALPNSFAGFTIGNRFFDKKLGVLIADNMQNQYYGSNSQFNNAVPNPQNNYKPYLTNIANRTFSNHQFNNGLNLHLDYKINDKNKLILNNVFLYTNFSQSFISNDTTLIGGDAGRSIYRNMPVSGTGSVHSLYRSTNNHQILENIKLEGQHIVSKHILFDWAGAYSLATRKSPDRAEFTTNQRISYDSVANKFNRTSVYYDGGTRIWQHNEDKDYNGIANMTYKFDVKKLPFTLKFGGLYRHKERDNHQNQYNQFAIGGVNNIGSRQQFTTIYEARDSIINPNGTAIYDINNYHAFENVMSGYGQLSFKANKLDILLGARVENTEQGYNYLQFIQDAINKVNKKYTDILPSILLKYRLNPKTNLRLSYFKSLARPNYFELIPYTIRRNDGYYEVGNPNLKHTTSDNFDIRYEIFPKRDQQIFIGGFYKNLLDPIENAFVSSNNSQLVFTPTNSAGKATIFGGEFVYSKQFGNIGINTNYTYTHSNVNALKLDPLTGNILLQNRPLQGQANHELNFSVDYKNPNKNYFLQLSYQYVGKTLAEVYANYGYDYYKQPQSFLAASADKKLGKHFTVFGKFNNLLNTPTRIQINGLITGNDISKASAIFGLKYEN